MSFLRLTRRRTIALVSAILVPGSVFAASKAELGPFRQAAKIKTVPVKQKTISQTISASGEISAGIEVNLKFQTSGQLSWVGVKEGDKVKKWQAIASLDRQELEKRLKKDLNTYVRERTEFEDVWDDYPDPGLTDAISRLKERAQIDLDQTVLDVESRDLALKYATIISPIDGVVTAIDVPVAGVNITPATAVFTVADPNSLVFEVQVDETDIRFIQEGQEVIIFLDSLPDQELQGKVAQISFTSETASGGGTVFPVKVSLPETEAIAYRIGMNGDANFLVSTRENVLTIPVEALQPDNHVWLKRAGDYQKVEVEVGVENDTDLEILSGLSEGDEVVSEGFEDLPDD